MKEAFKMDNKIYDILKWLCMLGLPALAIFVQSIGAIWNIPIMDGVSKTIVAINALLAGWLGISNAQYQAEIKEGEDNAE